MKHLYYEIYLFITRELYWYWCDLWPYIVFIWSLIGISACVTICLCMGQFGRREREIWERYQRQRRKDRGKKADITLV